VTINRSVVFHRLIPYFLLLCVLVASAFTYLASQSSTPAQAAWYNTGGTWTNRKTITIDHTKVSNVATTTYSNFPVLISLTDSSLQANASSTGADILFTASDGLTKLNYEREYYASSTGQLIAWVQIPTLSATSDTTIYMYYGNASATDQQNATSTWDSNYLGVWHFPNGTTLSVNDSTSNSNNGTNNGATATTGKIDGGINFYSANSQYVNDGTINLSGSAITIEGWVNATAFQSSYPYISMIAGEETAGAGGSAFLRFGDASLADNTEQFVLNIGGGQVKLNGAVSFSTSTWYFVVGTYDGSNMRLYVNGTQDTSQAQTGSFTADTTFYVSNSTQGARYFDGSMDEVRVSNSARSAAWIQTEYNNQSSPQTFYAVGGLQTQNRAKAGVAISGRGASGVGWYSTGGTWTNRRTITIDHTKVSSIATTTYSNFPMLFSTTDPGFRTVSNGGKVASSTGADILFTASDGLTKLNYERDSYSSSTGQLIAWVQIPTLSATNDTVIYMYYGNSSAIDQQNASGTWDSNYVGVWHFPNGTTLYTNDSTTNGYSLTNNGTVTATTGQIDGGASFSGSNYLTHSDTTALRLATAFTVSAWASPTTWIRRIPGGGFGRSAGLTGRSAAS